MGGGGGGGANMTWMRLLRLFKMMKTLRVVRVVGVFRELRMLCKSIVKSFATIIWSMVLIPIMLYVFSIVFMMGLTMYLLDVPPAAREPTDVEAIQTYWLSIWSSTSSLFMAVTGGADWEEIAEPLKS